MLLSIYNVSYKQQCLQLCPKGRETTVRHSQRSGQAVPHRTHVYLENVAAVSTQSKPVDISSGLGVVFWFMFCIVFVN